MHNCTRCASINNQVSELRTAAIDAAVELDHTKNDAHMSEEALAKTRRIIENVFDACEALDLANSSGEVAA